MRPKCSPAIFRILLSDENSTLRQLTAVRTTILYFKMDKSLDQYIAKNPVLQSGIIGARMRAKHAKRVHNSNEFWADSFIYQCEDMELENENNMANVGSAGLFDSKKVKKNYEELPIDEPYLSLDSDEEDCEKWFGDLKKSAEEAAISTSTKQRADSSNDKREFRNKNYNNNNNHNINNNLCDKKNILEEFGFKQSDGFDLRQIVDEKKNDERFNGPVSQWRSTPFNADAGHRSMKMEPFAIKNHKNNFKFKHPRAGNNRFGGNNKFYHKNTKSGNGISQLCSQKWQNPNNVNNCCCCSCSFQGFVPNYNSLFGFNGNGINGSSLNCDIMGKADQLLLGLNTCGLTNANTFNSSINCAQPGGCVGAMCSGNVCSGKTISNGIDIDATTFKQLLNISSRGNDYSNMLNVSENVPNTGCFDNQRNKGFKVTCPVNSTYPQQQPVVHTDVNMEDRSNDINNRKDPHKTISSVLGITPKELECDSMPAMLSLMQQIFENGITIKLFPGKTQAVDLISQSEQ